MALIWGGHLVASAARVNFISHDLAPPRFYQDGNLKKSVGAIEGKQPRFYFILRCSSEVLWDGFLSPLDFQSKEQPVSLDPGTYPAAGVDGHCPPLPGLLCSLLLSFPYEASDCDYCSHGTADIYRDEGK